MRKSVASASLRFTQQLRHCMCWSYDHFQLMAEKISQISGHKNVLVKKIIEIADHFMRLYIEDLWVSGLLSNLKISLWSVGVKT